MRYIELTSPSDIKQTVKLLQESSLGKLNEVEETVKGIIGNIREFGDAALAEYTQRFDHCKLEQFAVTEKEIQDACDEVSPSLLEAIKQAKENIELYHSLQKYSPVEINKPGITIYQVARPINRVGIYIPGGSYPYPSTLLMAAIPAICAGVKEIAVATPPGENGSINANILAAAKICGITEIYKAGGAQAIAALAYGTESIKRVDKICGPGNAYVTSAKRLVFGDVGIDMLAGPSEVLIIADESSNAAYVASDMLAQAEHDENAQAVLITNSRPLAQQAIAQLQKQLSELPADSLAHASIEKNGCVLLVQSLSDAMEISNALAPEHLELAVADCNSLLAMVENAGSIFVGEYTPEPVGDYFAGTNHTLPTSGTARFFSPLSTYDFLKRSSVLHYSKEQLNEAKDMIAVLARAEGLEAHARSVLRRFNG